MASSYYQMHGSVTLEVKGMKKLCKQIWVQIRMICDEGWSQNWEDFVMGFILKKIVFDPLKNIVLT